MPADTLTTHLDAFREAALSCPIPAAVELIGEKWAFLILRGALNGLQHFEEFQARPGNRAQHPVGPSRQNGRRRNPRADGRPDRRRRVIYSLTPKGEGLLPVVLALRQWGDEWGYGKMKVVLADKRDRRPVQQDLRPGA